MNKCKHCNEGIKGRDKRQIFCSRSCSASYNNKGRILSEESKDKISFSLSKQNDEGLTIQQVTQRRIAEKHASYERENKVESLYDLSKRTVSKIFKRMKLPCSNCKWYVEGVVGDIHHIIERKKGGTDLHDNLTYICPNCHRMVHSGVISPNSLINLSDYIGDKWEEFYFVKNGKLNEK